MSHKNVLLHTKTIPNKKNCEEGQKKKSRYIKKVISIYTYNIDGIDDRTIPYHGNQRPNRKNRRTK